ncbi:MAG: hypothetical protein V1913_05590 [Fibrobacterota bacterium]
MKNRFKDCFFTMFSVLLIAEASLFSYPHPEGFYKHLFMDGGAYLSPRTYFPAGNALADTLKYNFEYLATATDAAAIFIAYKKDTLSGCAVLNGCHPEGDTSALQSYSTGERYELFSAKIQYAASRVGLPRLKATLKNNVSRVMSLNAVAGHEKIGDYQYHHFMITVPAGASYLKLTLDGQPGYPFNLLCQARRHGL